MGKAGGIIGLIGGIFAVFAAIFTLFLGGIGSAFEAGGAKIIVDFGWYGLACAFMVIVFGAVALAKSNVGAFGLLLASAVGAAVGGTVAGICFGLSFVGGLLAASGKDSQDAKRTWWQWAGLPLGIVAAVAIATQVSKTDDVRALVAPAAPVELPVPAPQAAGVVYAAASAPAALVGQDFSKYVGQHPAIILGDSDIDGRLKAILGAQYPRFEENITVSSELYDDGSFYFGSGCAQHQCSMEESAFAINKATGAVVAAILTDGKVNLFGVSDIKDAPPPIADWSQEHTSAQVPPATAENKPIAR